MDDLEEDEAAESEKELPMPNPADGARAIYAISAAAELLQSAERKNAESSFEESIALSRDSMRMSSSAVLFLEGKVASDFESSIVYLQKRYDDIIPVAEWREVERLAKDNIHGRLSSLIGGDRSMLEKDAAKALESAAKFFGATSAIVEGAAAASGQEGGARESEEGPDEEGAVQVESPAFSQEGAEDVYGEAS